GFTAFDVFDAEARRRDFFDGPMFDLSRGFTTGAIFVDWFFWLIAQLLFVSQLIIFVLLLRSIALGAGDRRAAGACVLPLIFAGIYGGLRLIGFIFFFIAYKQFAGLAAAAITGMPFGREDAVRALLPSPGVIWLSVVFLWLGAIAFILFVVFFIMRIWDIRTRVS